MYASHFSLPFLDASFQPRGHASYFAPYIFATYLNFCILQNSCFPFYFAFSLFANMSFLGRGGPSPAGGVNHERVEMAINESVGSHFTQTVAANSQAIELTWFQMYLTVLFRP